MPVPALLQSRLGRIAVGLLAAWLVLLLALWIAVPQVTRWAIQDLGSRELGRAVTVEAVRFNPLKLAARVEGVQVAGLAGEAKPLLTLRRALVDASLTSLFRGAPVIDAVQVEGLELNAVRLEPQRFNFSDIVERLLAQPKSDQPARFAVYNIEVKDSAIHLDDRVRGRQDTLSAISIGIPFVSSLPTYRDINVQPAFSALLNDRRIALTGRTRPFADTLETVVELKLDALDLPNLLSFVPVRLNFIVPRGTLDTALEITFRRAAAATRAQPAQPQQLLIGGSFAINAFELQAPAGKGAAPLIGWKRLAVNLEQLAPLVSTARVRSVTLDAPAIVVQRHASGLNWTDLAARPVPTDAPAPAGAGTPPPPWRYQLQSLSVTGGKLQFIDDTVGRFTREFADLQISGSALGNIDGAPGTLKVAGGTSDDEHFALEGQVRLAPPLAGNLAVSATNWRLLSFVRYVAQIIDARIDGRSDATARLAFEQGDKAFALKLTDVVLTGRKLEVKGAPATGAALDLAQLKVEGGALDLLGRSLTVERVQLDGLNGLVRRLADGKLGWQQLLVRNQAEGAAGAPWKVLVKALDINTSTLRFEDEAVQPAVKVNATELVGSVRNITADGSQRADIALRTRLGKGSLAVNGDARWDTLAANLRIDLRSVDAALLRPYFADRINAVLAAGEVSTRGALNLAQPKDGALRVRYAGNARLANLHLLSASGDSDLLKWQALDVDKVTFLLQGGPPVVQLGTVALSDFFARVIVSDQGRLNLADLVKRDGASEPAAGAGAAANTAAAQAAVAAPATVAAPAPLPLALRIERITLARGNINFTDNFIKPNYTANLTSIGGSVSTLATDAVEPAALALAGSVDDEAPVTIDGRLNPLGAQLFLDITGSTKGVDLPRFSPYSAKYAGYGITKGKLSMDVRYKIEGRKLDASNRLFIDQLTFGERVDSPTATKLPVLLGVALLKNSRGEIDLNLPISGSLDDPEFSVGGLIIQVIVNLMGKVVTAPFALLASAFGGSAELGFVEFKPGTAALQPEQIGRIDTLGKALGDRPALKLDIIGRVEPEADTEGVRRAKYDAKLRAAKVRRLVRSGAASMDPATVTITPEERPALIAAVYDDEKIADKPRNLIGLAKTIPAAEMEALILQNTAVTPEDLRALANARASAVRDRLENDAKVPRERLFLVEPKLTAAGIQDKGAPTRVDFALK